MTALRTLFGFRGGVRVPEQSDPPTDGVPESPPVAAELVLPLSAHQGSPARALVAVGDTVDRGTRVAAADGAFSVPVHAPAAGTVVAIEARPVAHPSGLAETCIVIAVDGADRVARDRPAAMADWHTATPRALRRRIEACGITGLGGAAFPTAVKLTPGPEDRVEHLIINAVECEPWISCDRALLRERAADVVQGARVMAAAVGATRITFALDADHTETRASLAAIVDATADPEMAIAALPVRYPAGSERQLVETITGREVPADGLPRAVGALCQNAGTAAAVADAVCHGLPLTERVVTVAGAGTGPPRNLRVPFGTPLPHLLRAAGVDPDRVDRLIVGGPMMGFALPHRDVPVAHGVNCILAAEPDTLAPTGPVLPCIRCGDCAEACPVGLEPQQLHWHATAGAMDAAHDHGLFDCIECGACAWVCPSHLPLRGAFRHAKGSLRQAHAEQEAAEAALERYRFREQRLERERAERAERRARKKAALAGTDGGGPKAEIQAALARARSRKQGRD